MYVWDVGSRRWLSGYRKNKGEIGEHREDFAEGTREIMSGVSRRVYSKWLGEGGGVERITGNCVWCDCVCSLYLKCRLQWTMKNKQGSLLLAAVVQRGCGQPSWIPRKGWKKRRIVS